MSFLLVLLIELKGFILMTKFLIFIFIFLGCATKPVINIDKPIPDWKKLSLEEKIAQMIMVRIRGDFYNTESYTRNKIESLIQEKKIGGVITFGGSIHGTYHNIQHYQSISEIPLLVAADYERGTGQWMKGGTLFPSNMAVVATNNTDLAYMQGSITAKEAKAIGVNITFSPVMDINNNKDNPIINFRSYGDDPIKVSNFGTSFIKGVQDNGIIACAKHYPGHGNTSVDSHTSLPIISGSYEELMQTEFYPFKRAVEAGVEMIMTGHIALPSIDSSLLPASHSPIITKHILRDDWGYDGLIVTDGLEMGALTKSSWAGESAVRAVEAGSDILLLPINVEKTISSIIAAVNSGRISIDRINQSVERIWNAKIKLGLFDSQGFLPWSMVEMNINLSDNSNVAKTIARESITIVKDRFNYLPLSKSKYKKLSHIHLSKDEDVKQMLSPFSNDIKRTHRNVDEVFVQEEISAYRMKELIEKAQNSNMTIVSMLVRIRMDKGIATIDSTHAEFLRELNIRNIPFIAVSFGSPYLPDYSYIPTYVAAYGYGSVSLRAAADALWGRYDVDGVLPVELSPDYPRGSGKKMRAKLKSFNEVDGYDMSKAWAVIDSAIEKRIFPGAQVSIVHNGELIGSRGFGRHTYDLESRKVTDSSIYDVASLTKVLSTVPVFMKLMDQYQIGLDHEVAQYYPKFNDGNKKNITLKHLLTHSSGLPGYVEFFKDDNINCKQDVINAILKQDLKYLPGEDYEYSDLGIILLGSIIEMVSDQSLESLADRYVYKPLNMTSTMYNPDFTLKDLIVPTEYDSTYRGRLLVGEVHDENAWVMGGVAPHAGLFSTANDIAIFGQTMLNKGEWMGTRYFKDYNIEMFTERQNMPEGSDRAIGWDTPSQGGKSSAGDYFSNSSYGHLGFTGTSFWIDPENDIIVVLLTNRVHPTRKNKGIYGIRRAFHTEVMKEILNQSDTMGLN